MIFRFSGLRTLFTREERANRAKAAISTQFNGEQQAFLDLVLAHYVGVGVDAIGSYLSHCGGLFTVYSSLVMTDSQGESFVAAGRAASRPLAGATGFRRSLDGRHPVREIVEASERGPSTGTLRADASFHFVSPNQIY